MIMSMESSEGQMPKQDLGSILAKMDESSDKEGMTPSEAWRYREEVRAKYSLPECGYRWNDPQRYIDEIEKFLKEEGVSIREKHEFALFFRENPDAGALKSGPNVFRDNTVIVGSNQEDEWYGLRGRANQLAHESVHALQTKKYPSLPDEEAEKEAYFYQSLYPQKIFQYQDDPDAFKIFLQTIEINIQNSLITNQKINT